MNKQGWIGEKERHSLSRQGIKTNTYNKLITDNYHNYPYDLVKLKPTDYVTIIGKRWFQKTYGNTYHSVQVYVNGKLIGEESFRYGYGEQYIQTAHDILMKTGWLPKTGEHDYSAFIDMRRSNREHFTITVSDVGRQSDL
jgi:hypothetical protein